jgi:hypothetical protein
MRSWLGLAVILWSASASAEPVFSADPLYGALESCAARALEPPPLVHLTAYTDFRISQISGTKPVPAKTVPVGGPPADGLTRNEIDAVIKASAGAIRSCYQAELAKSPDLAGKIVVQFRIDGAGAVASASIKSTTMKSPPVESCVVGTIKKLAFPAKATASVTYPFIFTRV